MTTVYYAHPMSWYGTDHEKADLQLLRLNYDKVINPSSDVIKHKLRDWTDRRLPVMDFFANLIHFDADEVAYRPFSDGMIGAGVAREMFEAHIWGKPLVRIYGGCLGAVCSASKLLAQDGAKPDLLHYTLSVDETRSRIKRGIL